MIKSIVITAFILGLSISASAQDHTPDYSGNYACKLTASGGLKFDKVAQKWVGTTFDTNGETLLVKIKDTGDTGTYETAVKMTYKKYSVAFKDFGEPGEAEECVSSFLSGQFSPAIPILNGNVACRYFGKNYLLDLNSKKLQVTFDGGYMREAENHDTPYIAVGTCEKL
jgi:hypothetical protein